MAIYYLGGYRPDNACDYGEGFRAMIRLGTLLASFCIHWIVHGFVQWWNPPLRLTALSVEKGYTPSSIYRIGALYVQEAVFFIVLGLWAAKNSFLAAQNDPIVEKITFFREDGHTRLSDVECGIIMDVGILGSLFGGNLIFQCCTCCLGWEGPEVGMSEFVHHSLFMVLTIVLPYFYILGEVTTFAVAMELSTPVLLAVLFFEKLEGFDVLKIFLKILFLVLFTLVRPIWFGYGIYRSLQFWSLEDVAVENRKASDIRLVQGTQLLFFLAWVLQLVWLISIVRKAQRAAGKLCTNRDKQA